jgi:hypothetical protein
MSQRRPWDYDCPCVVIDDLVCFSTNNGIQLWDWTGVDSIAVLPRWREIFELIEEGNGIEAGRLCRAIEIAKVHRYSEFFTEGYWGGRDKPVLFETFMEIVEKHKYKIATKVAKQNLSRTRRAQYMASREEIMLAMIDAGKPYVCSNPTCEVTENLTIDHIKALSRGGSDEIGNLQFMCLPHNSSKGDR